MDPETRRKITALPKKERGQAEGRFLKQAYQRDQMISLLLPSRERSRFRKQPIEKRDEFALTYMRREGKKLVKLLPSRARSELLGAPEAKRPAMLLEGLFLRRLNQIQANLLPSQRRGMKSLSSWKKWEKTQHFLKVNHRRLLAKMPKETRAEILRLPPHRQTGKIRELLRAELKAASLSNLRRIGIQQLPLLLQWDAVQRARGKRKGPLPKKGASNPRKR
jgi:hypothetical protein